MQKLKFRMLEASDIDCRIATVSEKGLSLLLYKDARVDQNILDETVGPMNWQRSHSRDNANCTVSIWDEDKEQWISKEDTGKESYTEAEKGLASDSFKRACFNWGIGRELYTAPFIWVSAKDCKIVDSGRTDKNGKVVYTCYDRFRVSKIGYDDRGAINALMIKNKDGRIVYSLNGSEDGEPVEYPKYLEEKYVNSLFLELKRTGVGLNSLLKNYGASDVHDLEFDQWVNAMDILKKKPDFEKSTVPPDSYGDPELPWNQVTR